MRYIDIQRIEMTTDWNDDDRGPAGTLSFAPAVRWEPLIRLPHPSSYRLGMFDAKHCNFFASNHYDEDDDAGDRDVQCVNFNHEPRGGDPEWRPMNFMAEDEELYENWVAYCKTKGYWTEDSIIDAFVSMRSSLRTKKQDQNQMYHHNNQSRFSRPRRLSSSNNNNNHKTGQNNQNGRSNSHAQHALQKQHVVGKRISISNTLHHVKPQDKQQEREHEEEEDMAAILATAHVHDDDEEASSFVVVEDLLDVLDLADDLVDDLADDLEIND